MRAAGLVLAAALMLLPLRAAAEQVVAGLSQTRVSITTWFSGSEIFIYGAVKREAPIPQGAPLDVVIAVTGPSAPVIVRRKTREFGVWVNGPGLFVDAAPSFYAVSTTRPLEDVLSATADLRYGVGLKGLGQVIRLVDAPRWLGEQRDEYLDAVVRLQRNRGVYYEQIGGVTVAEETLFQTRLQLPAQLVEGDYRARIFLTRDREVIDSFETSIAVRKVGLEHWVDEMAHKRSALYGVLSVVVALVAGWAASALFRVAFP
ncbi:TIGR02186 family protein [Limibaculum sp. FT325]|uniref:TIGR02186 family protein n=1 Tax=Thermohalobaculum sediminis TaxID=2939436 RepID=UPI0020BEFDF6|nr:TIGR02186 family protein [Limibaculum sediminis]MCL5778135.1 TIGR02186 family protein [Limibaculum sediminis]